MGTAGEVVTAPILEAYLQKVCNANIHKTWIQQNRDPFWNQTFSNRWIRRQGLFEWSSRSPDLLPLEICIWGYLKSKVCGADCKYPLKEEIISAWNTSSTTLIKFHAYGFLDLDLWRFFFCTWLDCHCLQWAKRHQATAAYRCTSMVAYEWM